MKNINLKALVEDSVFFMYKNKIKTGTICSIAIFKNTITYTITYTIQFQELSTTKESTLQEEQIYTSKQDLLNDLLNNL